MKTLLLTAILLCFTNNAIAGGCTSGGVGPNGDGFAKEDALAGCTSYGVGPSDEELYNDNRIPDLPDVGASESLERRSYLQCKEFHKRYYRKPANNSEEEWNRLLSENKLSIMWGLDGRDYYWDKEHKCLVDYRDFKHDRLDKAMKELEQQAGRNLEKIPDGQHHLYRTNEEEKERHRHKLGKSPIIVIPRDNMKGGGPIKVNKSAYELDVKLIVPKRVTKQQIEEILAELGIQIKP